MRLRVRERFGADYVSQVLVGSKEARILSAGHDQLSTWGLLKNFRRQDVRQWVEQLVSQKFLRKEGEFNTVLVTEDGRRLLRAKCEPVLSKPVTSARGDELNSRATRGKASIDNSSTFCGSWPRNGRGAPGVPAYIVFGDAPLREMARVRPSTTAGLLQIRGVGQQKLADFGEAFTDCIVSYCRENSVEADVVVAAGRHHSSAPARRCSHRERNSIIPLFEQGMGIDDVAKQLGEPRRPSGVLRSVFQHRHITDVTPWLKRVTWNAWKKWRTKRGQHGSSQFLKPSKAISVTSKFGSCLASLSNEPAHPFAR